MRKQLNFQRLELESAVGIIPVSSTLNAIFLTCIDDANFLSYSIDFQKSSETL